MTLPLSRAGALEEARRRYGPGAQLLQNPRRMPWPPRVYSLWVRGETTPRGKGDSWEAAFADADRRSGAR